LVVLWDFSYEEEENGCQDSASQFHRSAALALHLRGNRGEVLLCQLHRLQNAVCHAVDLSLVDYIVNQAVRRRSNWQNETRKEKENQMVALLKQ
jgi:hypothetical protein